MSFSVLWFETVDHVINLYQKKKISRDDRTLARFPERAERGGGDEPEIADDARERRCPFSTWRLYVQCAVTLRLESDSTLDNLVPHNSVCEQLKAGGIYSVS